MNVGLLLIATRKYTRFLDALLPGVRAHFLHGESVHIHVFSDKQLDLGDDVIVHDIPSWGWPDATLRRYEAINGYRQELLKEDYLFYMDVDMLVVDTVGREILAPLVATSHPGYHVSGGGTWETNPESMAFVAENERRIYVAGGFQGGVASTYLDAARHMKLFIKDDEVAGLTAVWHDESHWNAYVSDSDHTDGVKILSPEYCYPSAVLAAAWGLSGMRPRILALDKNHEELRS